MTKSSILAHVNAANTNKDIKWYIVEKTDDKIVLTNSYDKCVNITIKIGEDCITVKDNHVDVAVEYLFKGETRWDDYKDDETGILLALKAAVNYFNHTY